MKLARCPVVVGDQVEQVRGMQIVGLGDPVAETDTLVGCSTLGRAA